MNLRDDAELWREVKCALLDYRYEGVSLPNAVDRITSAILDAIDRRTPAAPPALVASEVGTIGADSKFTADQPVSISATAPPGPPATVERCECKTCVDYDLVHFVLAATQGPAPVEPSEPTWPEPHLMTDEERAKVAGYLRRKYAGTPRAPRMNDATPEDELDCPDSGPFCAHWGEPGNCERPCSSCGHVCHDWICEADGCKCAECTEWICEADGCKCAECTE